MEPLTVLIADDHPLFRAGLRALLASMSEVSLLGEATDGAEVVRMAEQLQPDLVLLDLQMPEGGGLPAIRQIVRTSPHIRILVVTMFMDDDSVFAAMRAGARGYVLKGARHDEMLRAIRAVGSGEAIFSPSIASRMMDFFASSRATTTETIFPDLTEREREVLSLMTRGQSNTEIADALTISVKTVRNHVSNIFSKLQVVDRAQAVLRARDAGLG